MTDTNSTALLRNDRSRSMTALREQRVSSLTSQREQASDPTGFTGGDRSRLSRRGDR